MLPVWARSLTPCTEFVQISRRLCSAQPFRELLADEGAVVTDPATLHAHNTDWTGRVEGASKVLLKPGSTTDVSRVLQHCSKHRWEPFPAHTAQYIKAHAALRNATRACLQDIGGPTGWQHRPCSCGHTAAR